MDALGLFSRWQEIYLLSRNSQTGSGAHLTSHSVGTGSSVLWVKVTDAWGWPLTSI